MSADRKFYEQLRDKMEELTPKVEAGDLESCAQFHRLWRELETVKNRHGGMPPEEDLTAIKQPAA